MATNRTWEPVETRLVSEWLALRWPNHRTFQRVRVGGIPAGLFTEGLSAAELRLAGAWRRWVDAAVIDPPRLVVVEAGVLPDLGDISKLVAYMELLPRTPEFSEYRTWPVAGILLYALEDSFQSAAAARAGLQVELYHPAWITDYLKRQEPRQQRPPLSPV